MEMKITICGLEAVAESINNLAKAMMSMAGSAADNAGHFISSISAQSFGERAALQEQVPVSPQSQIPVFPQNQIPAQQQQTVPSQAPAQPAPAGQISTSATSYTLDDIAGAAITLMDAGRQGELLELLGQFGVQSLPELSQDKYGAFATALRGLGAQI